MVDVILDGCTVSQAEHDLAMDVASICTTYLPNGVSVVQAYIQLAGLDTLQVTYRFVDSNTQEVRYIDCDLPNTADCIEQGRLGRWLALRWFHQFEISVSL
jgi:hypothetical protein